MFLFVLQLAKPLVSRFLSLFSRSFPAAANTAFSSAIEAALVSEDWHKLCRGFAKAIRAAIGDGQNSAPSLLQAEWSALSAATAAFDRHRSAMQVGVCALHSSIVACSYAA
jgi:hypothetical protein